MVNVMTLGHGPLLRPWEGPDNVLTGAWVSLNIQSQIFLYFFLRKIPLKQSIFQTEGH